MGVRVPPGTPSLEHVLGLGDYHQLEFDRLRKDATALRNRQEFQRSQLTELARTGFESWAKESFEIATKIAYRNGGQIGTLRNGNMDCTMVAAAPVVPSGYVLIASRIADRTMILGISLGGPADAGHSNP